MPSLKSSDRDWRELARQVFLRVRPDPPEMHESFHAKAEDYTCEITVLESVFRQVGDVLAVKAAIREFIACGDFTEGNGFGALYRRLLR